VFSLQNQDVKIANVNFRAEKHGEENVKACDLKIEATMHSSVLDCFDKGLRKTLYRKPSAGEQSNLPLGDDNLTERKLPRLAPLKWDEDFPGYELHIVTGLAIDEELKQEDVELSGFVFEAMDGGSVAVTFRASLYPDGRAAGKLFQLIQETVEITLIPPDVEDRKAA
jgi:hypothetical protein